MEHGLRRRIVRQAANCGTDSLAGLAGESFHDGLHGGGKCGLFSDRHRCTGRRPAEARRRGVGRAIAHDQASIQGRGRTVRLNLEVVQGTLGGPGQIKCVSAKIEFVATLVPRPRPPAERSRAVEQQTSSTGTRAECSTREPSYAGTDNDHIEMRVGVHMLILIWIYFVHYMRRSDFHSSYLASFLCR